jgi:hypothetical protein
VAELSEDREAVLARIRDALEDIEEEVSKEDAVDALDSLVDKIESRLREVCTEEYELIDVFGERTTDEGELNIAVVRCNGHSFEIHIELVEEVTYIARYAGIEL